MRKLELDLREGVIVEDEHGNQIKGFVSDIVVNYPADEPRQITIKLRDGEKLIPRDFWSEYRGGL